VGDASRALRESVVQGLAKVGLVWSLAVLAALFMISAAQGSDGSAYASVGHAVDAVFASVGLPAGATPRIAALVLGLTVLASSLCVLALGALASRREAAAAAAEALDPEPTLVGDLSLALGLGLSA
jgi:hypothetical protein